MASIIWLKIHLGILFWLEILCRQMWNKNGTRQRSNLGCATDLLHDYSSFSTQRLNYIFNYTTFCAKKCFEFLIFWSTQYNPGCPFDISIPCRGKFSCFLIFAESSHRYLARRKVKWGIWPKEGMEKLPKLLCHCLI